MKPILLSIIAAVMLFALQALAEQADAWTRADIVVPCEVIGLERTGLHCGVELLSYYDWGVYKSSISLLTSHSLAVGDMVPCALVLGRLIPIRGYGSELYRRVSDYKIEPVVIQVPVGVRLKGR